MKKWKDILQSEMVKLFSHSHICMLCGSSFSSGKNSIQYIPHPILKSLCSTCIHELEWIIGQSTICSHCGRILFRPDKRISPNQHGPMQSEEHKVEICYDCKRLTNTSLHYNRSLLCYSHPLRQWMYLYKYKGKETLSLAFSNLLATGFREFFSDVQIDLITSIPLHPTRMQERGFNQSEQMAKGLSEIIKIPYCSLLLRQKPTEKQSKKDRHARLIAIRGAFRPLLQTSSIIQRKHVLIVDDVYTTGATLEEAAKVLKECGAQGVYSLTVAR